MLDQANSEFVNSIVTAIRYGVYGVIGLAALTAAVVTAIIVLKWIWSGIKWAFWWDGQSAADDKAKRRMRDLGY